jgi:hypothetical protein
MEVSGQLYVPPALPLVKEPRWSLGAPQSRAGPCGVGKNSLHCRESNTDSPAVQSVACRDIDWTIPAPPT